MCSSVQRDKRLQRFCLWQRRRERSLLVAEGETHWRLPSSYLQHQNRRVCPKRLASRYCLYLSVSKRFCVCLPVCVCVFERAFFTPCRFTVSSVCDVCLSVYVVIADFRRIKASHECQESNKTRLNDAASVSDHRGFKAISLAVAS